ncbi:MAG: pilus assembly PilX N-terminal domain-containing protein [Gemmatimonadota bacterium]|nr:pilus assembly PilX N-terminal domain-containing protein [Gemmatimonadota bacterium]
MLNNAERRGFAIPVALLVIAVLTIMIAGGFSLVSAERRSVADQKSQISAFRIAEQGLEVFLVRRDSLMAGTPNYTRVPGAKDSVRITMTGGYADVSLTRLRPPKGSQSGLYVVRSRGVETVGAYAGTPQGVRTVAQYVLWEPAPMQVLAGWTALSGIQKNGNAGTLGGIDVCGDSAAVAGVAVPVNPGYTGKTVAVGDPPVDTIAPTEVDIDWNAIVNLNSITPTITLPPGTWPTAALEAAYADSNSTYYPIIRVNASDFSLPSSGKGMIIATGSISLNGSVGWKGVLLVGNDITSNGNNEVQGATVSGLNVKLGTYVPAANANGTKVYNYNSCEVAKATTTMGALVTLRNTWVDNWVEY